MKTLLPSLILVVTYVLGLAAFCEAPDSKGSCPCPGCQSGCQCQGCCSGGHGFQADVLDPYVEIQVKDLKSIIPQTGKPEVDRGSGVAIQVKGKVLILTASHLFPCQPAEAKDRLVIDLIRKTKVKSVRVLGKMVGRTPPEEEGGHDLALVEPADPRDFPTATFDPSCVLEPGQDCWYVGTPYSIHRCLEKSIINQPDYESPGGYPFILINGNGFYGSSGGPVFVKVGQDYRLVGIVVRLASRAPKSPLQAENQKSIKDFLESYDKPAPVKLPFDFRLLFPD